MRIEKCFGVDAVVDAVDAVDVAVDAGGAAAVVVSAASAVLCGFGEAGDLADSDSGLRER